MPESARAPGSLPARIRALGLVAESRRCEQCGAVFVPVREHARFCGGEWRAAWNREHLGDPAVEASALAWSMTAMSEATARLPAVKVWDQERALAAIGEAVWWITMVDATLVRHHPGAYDTVMAAHAPAERQRIVEALAGLRFVRNQLCRGAPLGETIGTGAGGRRITGWTWKSVGEPDLAGLPPRAQAWELDRYRAYQARLAGHTIGEIFGRAVTFLTLTGANAASSTATSQPARHPNLAELARQAPRRTATMTATAASSESAAARSARPASGNSAVCHAVTADRRIPRRGRAFTHPAGCLVAKRTVAGPAGENTGACVVVEPAAVLGWLVSAFRPFPGPRLLGSEVSR